MGPEREKGRGGRVSVFFLKKNKKVKEQASDSSTNREGLLFSVHVVHCLATS